MKPFQQGEHVSKALAAGTQDRHRAWSPRERLVGNYLRSTEDRSGAVGAQHNVQTLHNLLWGKLWLSHTHLSVERLSKSEVACLGSCNKMEDRVGILTQSSSALSGAGHQLTLQFPSLKLG